MTARNANTTRKLLALMSGDDQQATNATATPVISDASARARDDLRSPIGHHRRDRHTTGIAFPQRIRESAAGVRRSARMSSPSGLVPCRTHFTRSSNDGLFGHVESAVTGDPVDPLDQQIVVLRLRYRALQRSLEVNRHEQIAGAVHGQDRPFDLPSNGTSSSNGPIGPQSHVRRLPPHRRVQAIGRQAETVVDP